MRKKGRNYNKPSKRNTLDILLEGIFMELVKAIVKKK